MLSRTSNVPCAPLFSKTLESIIKELNGGQLTIPIIHADWASSYGFLPSDIIKAEDASLKVWTCPRWIFCQMTKLHRQDERAEPAAGYFCSVPGGQGRIPRRAAELFYGRSGGGHRLVGACSHSQDQLHGKHRHRQAGGYRRGQVQPVAGDARAGGQIAKCSL